MEWKSRLISHFSERKRFFHFGRWFSFLLFSALFATLISWWIVTFSLFQVANILWQTFPSSTFSSNNIIYELFHLEQQKKKKRVKETKLINQSKQSNLVISHSAHSSPSQNDMASPSHSTRVKKKENNSLEKIFTDICCMINRIIIHRNEMRDVRVCR